MKPRTLGLTPELALALPSAASSIAAPVTRALNGDTIEILPDNHPLRIRLSGIDCPEEAQAFGTQAKKLTSDLCFGKVVTDDTRGTDRYGRTIGEVTLPDGRDLNHELVAAGLAWWYRKYAPDDRTLMELESQARAAHRGLWSDPDPIAPWDWRHHTRSTPAPAATH